MFRPIVSMFNMLIVPVAMAGFFYYLLRPIVDYLERRKIKRSIGVLMLYFVFAGLCAIFGIVVWPTLREQIENFISNTPSWLRAWRSRSTSFSKINSGPAIYQRNRNCLPP